MDKHEAFDFNGGVLIMVYDPNLLAKVYEERAMTPSLPSNFMTYTM